MKFHEMVQLLDMFQEGKSCAAVGCCYDVNESTIRYIKKNEVAIRSTIAVNSCESAKKIMTIRNKHLVKMESTLVFWISNCKKKSIPLSGNIICEKVQKLYHQFDGGDGAEGIEELQPRPLATLESKDFQASKAWFDCFQKQFKIKCVSLYEETVSADKEAAEKYLETFRQIIEEKGYKLEQVFYMDKTGLFWKKMPFRTYAMKDKARVPGLKAQMDRVMLITCSNAAGFMMKPGLIYKSMNLRAFKNKNKNLLPAHWMHNPQAWITKSLTLNWFHLLHPSSQKILPKCMHGIQSIACYG
ncbi:tigger transposable element-derived protein 1-like [Octopus sinensis]|uniref:Tigger transposable element-derived protein 1-like n=1 Tax=Octopus sinensis TaxID=2607531 RepID=A0A6P7S6I7_9MOLL|nr:tigger transposable element-derived protein 1-like [Octopus sinensis]